MHQRILLWFEKGYRRDASAPRMRMMSHEVEHLFQIGDVLFGEVGGLCFTDGVKLFRERQNARSTPRIAFREGMVCLKARVPSGKPGDIGTEFAKAEPLTARVWLRGG